MNWLKKLFKGRERHYCVDCKYRTKGRGNDNINRFCCLNNKVIKYNYITGEFFIEYSPCAKFNYNGLCKKWEKK